VLALIPAWLLAMAAFWFVLTLVVDVPFWLFCVVYLAAWVLLFLRSFQRVVLTRMLGLRRPTPEEQEKLAPAWGQVTQAARSSPKRFVLAVLDADDINAYACGGHLVVVTSYAVRVLRPHQLAGVLAHELSHHLGLHTVALTVQHWLTVPILLLARIGFFLQNVAQAAAESFGQGSTWIRAIGRVVALILRGIAWLFLLAILISNAIANIVGRNAEFAADRRAADIGFGPQLAAALRQFVDAGLSAHGTTWRDRAFASHPPPRVRIARIDAYDRRTEPQQPPAEGDGADGEPRPPQRDTGDHVAQPVDAEEDARSGRRRRNGSGPTREDRLRLIRTVAAQHECERREGRCRSRGVP
jgi:Zn-dependent protease with chaperone function